MNLSNICVKKSYINQGNNNFVDTLIKPALQNSVIYRRSVGFFSSSVFRLIINPLTVFIRNGGKVKLIVSPELSEDDINSIRKGYEQRELLKNAFLSNMDNEIALLDDNDLNILGLLVAKGILDIKVVAVKNGSGIYHDKLGIFSDDNNNHVAYYGSANSSITAYQNNYEKIRTAVSWEAADEESVLDEIFEFDNLWHNMNPYIETYDFMDSLKERIVTAVSNRKKTENNHNPIELFDYQEEAIGAWFNNENKGFFVMATGTGKTWTAIYAAKKLVTERPALIVIAAPYKHLIKQWAEDVQKAFPTATTVLISSENQHWPSLTKQAIMSQQYNGDKQIVLITTIKSFQSQRFEDIVSKSEQDKLLIVDEAHRFTTRPDSLSEDYRYMLGLSATPLNGKNNEAGEALLNSFGGQVYNLPIEIALEKKFLVPYNYYPIIVSATEEEETKFSAITARMTQCFVNGICIDKDQLAKLSRDRLRIISMANQKTENIDDLIMKVNDKDHFVVYCGDGKLSEDGTDDIRHIQHVKKHLDSLGLKTSQFTASEDMTRRMQLVDMFNKKEIDSLVAIRCLDEGINIPSIKSALILSSNDDYREFVQRRGRILRKYDGKTHADIYDVIVLPSTATPKMAQIELRRFYEYARLGINKDEQLKKLNELINYYGLTMEDITFFNEELEADLDE